MTDTIPCVDGPCHDMRLVGQPGQFVTCYHSAWGPDADQSIKAVYRVSDDGTHGVFVEGSVEMRTPEHRDEKLDALEDSIREYRSLKNYKVEDGQLVAAYETIINMAEEFLTG